MTKTKSLFNPFQFRAVRSTKGNHAFANSVLRIQLSKLLRIGDYEKLVEQDSVADICKMLSDTYGYSLSSSSNLKEFFLYERQQILRFIEKTVGGYAYGAPKQASIICDFLRLPLDFFNLKVLSKGELENKTWEELPLSITGFLAREQLKALYENANIGFLHPLLKKALADYRQMSASQKTSYFLDVFWDHQIHKTYQLLLKRLKSDIVSSLYETDLDIKNILTTLRLKKIGQSEEEFIATVHHLGKIRKDVLLSIFRNGFENVAETFSTAIYNKEVAVGMEAFKDSEDLTFLEKHLREFWLKACHRFISLARNEDLCILYDWLKQNEYANIQIILTGIANKMGHPWILSHLRVASI